MTSDLATKLANVAWEYGSTPGTKTTHDLAERLLRAGLASLEDQATSAKRSLVEATNKLGKFKAQHDERVEGNRKLCEALNTLEREYDRLERRLVALKECANRLADCVGDELNAAGEDDIAGNSTLEHHRKVLIEWSALAAKDSS